jgi:hypothetical protein
MCEMKNNLFNENKEEQSEFEKINMLISDIERIKRTLTGLADYLKNVKSIGSISWDRQTVRFSFDDVMNQLAGNKKIAEWLFIQDQYAEFCPQESLHTPPVRLNKTGVVSIS